MLFCPCGEKLDSTSVFPFQCVTFVSDGQTTSVLHAVCVHGVVVVDRRGVAQSPDENAEEEAMEERYPMCQDQPAQIDCRVEACIYYSGGGQCSNVSLAITLNPGKSYVCWSGKTLEELDVERQSTKAEEGTMKVIAVIAGPPEWVNTDRREWPHYKRFSVSVWERRIGYEWFAEEEHAAKVLEAAYQEFMRKGRAELALELERNAPQHPLFYRRCSPWVWEARLRDHWEWVNVDDPAMLAELENTYQNSKPEEAMGSTLKGPGQRYTDDFEWKADPANEFAQMHEALAYLAGVGGVVYPWWAWAALDAGYPSLFARDNYGLKVRQWRGKGFAMEGLLTNGGKWGVILVISAEELVRLWHKSPEQKLEFAKQITRETTEHAKVVGEGRPYPEFVPTITGDPEDNGKLA